MGFLITGFPGFIGRRLVRTLLERHPSTTVVAVVEPAMLDKAREVAAGHERIELVVGDISKRRLALADEDWARLTAEVTHVFHLAAIYNLAVPEEIAQRVNVDGTGNVLELCAACPQLKRLAYVSTAYVAGLRSGVVYEHELVMGQDFKNHYESTKFQAEVWVRDRMGEIPTTILRPAIVVGDSTSGETEKFDGPYYILRAISRAEKMHTPPIQLGSPDASFNVVPVDFVVDAIAQAAFLEEAAGETLHLVDPEPLSSSELVCALAEAYGAKAPRMKLPPRMIEGTLRVSRVSDLLGGTPRESIVYLNHRVTFDTRRAVELLTPLDLRPPNFRDYVGAMVSYFKQHEDD
jgi:thioester reductase-like protein